MVSYDAVFTNSSASGFISFDPDTREFTIESDDNQYGDTTYEVTVTAENIQGIQADITFDIIVTKDCTTASLDINGDFELD